MNAESSSGAFVSTTRRTSGQLPGFACRAFKPKSTIIFAAIAALALLLTGFGTRLGAQTDWTGNASTDFSNSSNWDNGVPTAGVTTVIDLSTGNISVISSGGFTTGLLEIGNATAGAANELELQAGNLTSDSVILGNETNSAGTMLVTGSSSAWLVNTTLVIGNIGNGNFSITNGGQVTTNGNANLSVFFGSNSTVNVTDTGSIWNLGSNTLYVAGSGNSTLTIANGGNVTSGAGYLGYSTFGNGIVNVDGAGSKWALSSLLTVAFNGNGTVSVTNGGLVSSAGGLIGYGVAEVGTMSVSGTNSSWTTNGNALFIGESGTGNLAITNGGNVSSGATHIGYFAGANGTVSVDGANSTWNLGNNSLAVGDGGTGSLSISNGGKVTDGNGSVILANSSGSNGTVTVTGANATWIFTGNLEIGNASTASLSITNGGNVSSGAADISAGTGSAGTVTVSGTNSTLNVGGAFNVGKYANGSLFITNGGKVVTNGTTYLSWSSGAAGNATVDGANSTWDLGNSSLTVSGYGNGTLVITNGGTVTSGAGEIGYSYFANAGSVTVDGTNSTWNMGANNLIVSDSGTVTLTVSNGGNVSFMNATVANSIIGTGTINITSGGKLLGNLINIGASGTGIVTVSGAGSTISTGGGGTDYVAGGGTGTLNVSNGGYFFSNGSLTIGSASGHTGNATFSDAGSNLTVTNYATVGDSGTGLLSFYNGSSGETGGLIIGNSGSGSGTVTVDGVSSGGNQTTLAVTSTEIAVGVNNTGTLNVSNGGFIESTGFAANDTVGLMVGENGGTNSHGYVTVTGYDATSGDRSEIDLYSGSGAVGYAGNGTLTINNGGIVNFDYANNGVGLTIGNATGSNGNVSVADIANISSNIEASTLNVASGALIVGNDGAGSLYISNGANVNAWDADASGVGVYVANGANSTANVTVSGPADASDQSTLLVDSGALVVGNGGNGTLTVTNGGQVEAYSTDSANIGLYIGKDAGSTGTVTVTGSANVNATVITSTLNVPNGSVIVGDNGTGALTITNGALVAVGSGSNLTLGVGASGNGTLNVTNGGTLEVGGTNGIAAGSGSAAFNFNNGTLKVTGSNLTASVDVALTGNTSYIDTNGFTANWTGSFSGAGGLDKLGLGNLILSNSNSYTGNTSILGGGLELDNAQALAGSTLLYNTGGGSLVIGNLANLTLGGVSGNASIDLDNSTAGAVALTVGGNNLSTAYTGGFTGNGSLEKTGVGVLTLGGNSTYTGGTNVVAGTLVVDGSLGGNLGTSSQSSGDFYVGAVVGANFSITNGAAIYADEVSMANQVSDDDTGVVSGLHSLLHANETLDVGENGLASLSVVNGGSVSVNDINSDDVSMFLGDAATANGSMTVSGFANVNATVTKSSLQVIAGAAAVGYNGTGALTVANGGSVGFYGNDSNGIGLYLGENAGSTGNVTVTGVVPSPEVQSSLQVDTGAGVLGNSGNGTLTVTNGGYAGFEGIDGNGVGLYISNSSASTGNLTVSGVNAAWLVQSALDIGSGATMVGRLGTGTLTVANGGHAYISGNDDAGVGLYIGNPANTSFASVTTTGVANISGNYYQSEIEVDTGATVVDGNGSATLQVTNGGKVDLAGNDSNSIGLTIGGNANSTGSVTVSDFYIGDSGNESSFLASNLAVDTGAVVVGGSGNGTLTVSNSSYMTVDGVDANGIGLYVGENTDSIGNVTVADFDDNYGLYSELDVNNGAVAVGYNGYGVLTVANGAGVYANGEDSNELGLAIGYNAGATGSVIVDGAGPNPNFYSEIDVNNGTTAVGYNGTGTLRVSNGGQMYLYSSDDNGVALYVGYNAGSTGNVTVTGVEPISEDGAYLSISGAAVVGYDGNGTFSVTNGGIVDIYGSDTNELSFVVGYDANSTANVSVSDVGNINGDTFQSEIYMESGAGAVGYSGNGNLSITNGARVYFDGSDGNSFGLYLGYDANVTGNVAVSDVANIDGDYYQSELDVGGGALIVGADGVGNLAITNGGYVDANDYASVGGDLYYLGAAIGYDANSTGTVTVSGVANIDDNVYQSELDVSDAALLVGYYGNGTLAITNGGYVTASSYGYAGDSSVGFVAGYDATANGTVTVSDVANIDGDYYQSELYVDDAALLVGYNGTGTLTITNGGYVYADGNDDNIGAGLIIGYSANSTGNVTVSDFEPNSESASNLTVDYGALVVGYNGTGNLNISNGGVVDASGSDEDGFGLYIGYDANSTGTTTVTGVEPNSETVSSLLVEEAPLVVGGAGNGTLTISNGGHAEVDNSVSGIGAYLGYDANATGTVNVTGVANISGDFFSSVFDNYAGALAVGVYGAGNLVVSNGGYVLADGLDFNDVGLSVGYYSGSTGNVTVTGIEPDSTSASELEVDYGTLVVGGSGNGTLTVSNGGYVLSDDTDSDPVGLSIGDGNASYGNMTVTGGEPDLASPSTLEVDYGATIVGNSGNGSLTVADGAYANISGSDDSPVGMYIGYDANGTGIVTVTGVANLSGNYYPSYMEVDNGGLEVGYNGTGSLVVSNGGNVSLNSADGFGDGITIGYNAGSSGNVTVTGGESDSGLASNLSVNESTTVVGGYGNATLTVSNGGRVYSAGDDSYASAYVGAGNGSFGTALVTDPGSIWDVGTDGDYSLAVGYEGTGNVTVANGGNVTVEGYDDSYDGALFLGVDSGAEGSVLVTGPDSQFTILSDTGSAIIGLDGNGTLSVANGGYFYDDGVDGDNTAMYIGYDATGTGSVSVSDIELNTDTRSELEVDEGMIIVGEGGNGTLTIANGGFVNSDNNNSNGVDVIIGDSANSTGNVTVAGIVPVDYNPSTHDYASYGAELDVDNGALMVGNEGTGSLFIANGGFVYAGGINSDGIGLYVGANAGSTGNLTVTDVANVTVDAGNMVYDTQQSTVMIDNGALAVGYNGNGSLLVANGGYIDDEGEDSGNQVGAYLGYDANATGNMVVTGFEPVSGAQSEFDVYDGALVVGYNGTGNLLVSNGGYVYSDDQNYDTGVGVYVGANANSTGNVTVTGFDANSTFPSEFEVAYGSIVVGGDGNGSLTISNAGYVFSDNDNSNGVDVIIGDGTNSTGAVTVTDVANVDGELYQSDLEVDNGSLVVGNSGNGSLTITNGGSAFAFGADDNREGMGIGQSTGGNGTVLVSGVNYNSDLDQTTPSELEVYSGALVVGGSGNGNLTVANGGYANISGNDDNGVGTYIGYDANATGTITVADVANIDGVFYQSELDVLNAGLEAGYNGTGSLLVSNGGYVWLDGSDSNEEGLALGYTVGSTGNVTVTGVEADSGYASEVDVNSGATVVGGFGNGTLIISNGGTVYSSGDDGYDSAYVGAGNTSVGTALVTDPGSIWDVGTGEGYSLVVGYDGTGNLTVANGGNVTIEGWDNDYHAALFVGQDSGSNGSILVTGPESLLDIVPDTGSAIIGLDGNGSLTVANGGYVDSYGNDSNSIGLYLGYDANATGNVTVTGVANISGNTYASELDVEDGATVVGYNGTGSLTVSNGGYANISGSDGNGIGLYIGYDANATASVTVTGVEPSTEFYSEMDVEGGALVVGYNGNGTLTLSNGGEAVSDSSDGNGIGMYLGSDANVTGNVTVTDVANISGDYYQSQLDVYSGALVVGFNGTGNLAITNGGYAYADDLDGNDVGMYLGYSAGSTGNVTVSGVEPASGYWSELEVDYGTLVVGGAGNGTLTVANGGYALSDDYDGDSVGLSIGDGANSTGSVLVTGIEPNSVHESTLEVDFGAAIVGNQGNGSLTLANAGYANISGSDENSIGLYVGYDANATGNVTVTDVGNLSGNYHESSMQINSGALVVGYNGTGNLTVANGAYLDSEGADANDVSIYLGDNANATGSLTVDGVEAGSEYESDLQVSGGSLVVGGAGYGTLIISNGGYVDADGSDVNGTSLAIGSLAGSTGNVSAVGYEVIGPDTFDSQLTVNSGTLIVGDAGNGTLSVGNGGIVEVDNGYDTVLASQSGSSGTVNLNAGGTFVASGNISSGSGTAAFNLNGGTLQAGDDINVNTTLSLTANSSINPNSYTVTVSHGINGAGSLSTTGASGTVILNGNSTYPSTTVGAGNFVVNSVLASNVTVNGTGAVLGGNGTINGSVTVDNGGISPGIANTLTGNQASGFANLTINGDLAMNVTAATMVWHLDSASAASDFLKIQGNLTTGSQSSTIITFDFEHTGYFDGVNPTTYTLLTADDDLQTAGFSFEAIDAINNSSSFIFANGGTTLEFVIVPEPATWGLILGGAMLLLGFIRKRRRRD